MKPFHILLSIALLALLLTTTAHALPDCPKTGVYHNCYGTYTFPDDSKYVGEWKDNKKHGKGTYTYSNGDKYTGEYKDNKRHGKGTVTSPDGYKYVGEFKGDKWHGKGTMTSPNSEKYIGGWRDGEPTDL